VHLVSLVQLVLSKNIITSWNDYIELKCSPETAQTTLSTQIAQDRLIIFEKIYNSNIKGRHLELFFPLFIITNLLWEDSLDKMIEIAKDIVFHKKQDDLLESRDVALIEFISKKEVNLNFKPISELTREFKEYIQEEDEQYSTISSKWIGRALKRLKLIIDKRRIGSGVEVILNISKAKEKIKLFKTLDKDIDKSEVSTTK